MKNLFLFLMLFSVLTFGSNVVVLSPSNDSYVSSTESSMVVGDSSMLNMKYEENWWNPGVYNTSMVALNFDLKDIPTDVTITSAILKLYATKALELGVNGNKTLHAIESNWNEYEITWDNLPSYSMVPVATNENDSFNVYEEYDVTEYVDNKYGFILEFDNYEPKHIVCYYSKESNIFPPELIITFDVTGIINNTIPINWNKDSKFVLYDIRGKQVKGINTGFYIKVFNGESQKILNIQNKLYKY